MKRDTADSNQSLRTKRQEMNRLYVLLTCVCVLGTLIIVGFFAFLAVCSYKISHPEWNITKIT